MRASSEDAPSEQIYAELKKIQGLFDKTQALGLSAKDEPALLVSGGEFILEGLYALKKISRNEELGYYAEPHRPARPEGPEEEPGPLPHRRRPLN